MFLTKYKLHTASKLFGRSAIRYIICTYPEEQYQAWQFSHDKVPQNYWTTEKNRVDALKYVFEVEMKWKIEDVKEKLTWSVLEEKGLRSLHYYYSSLFSIITAVYKIEISPWEIANSEVPNGTWEYESNRISAVKWLILRTKLQNEQINRKAFAKYGLSRLLGKYYCDNATRAIRETLDCDIEST